MKSFMRGIVDHKGLLSILAVLVVAIIGLTAGIIITNNTTPAPTTGGNDDPSNPSNPSDPNNPNNSNAGEDNIAYIQTYDETKTRAKGLLSISPDNVDLVKKIYTDIINGLSRSENPDRICQYIVAEAEVLEDAGHKEEALSVLLKNSVEDLELTEYNLSEYYRTIISLARDLGLKDIEEEYLEKHRSEIKEIVI